jgi:hypothetical protein
MNFLGITQSMNVDVFLELMARLRQQGVSVGRVGAWVSLARHFQTSSVVRKHGGGVTFLKEWEAVGAARSRAPDYAWLRQIEDKLGPGSLWTAVIGDRRLIYGPYCKFTQDYRSRFTDEEIYAILDVTLKRIERAFDELEPDAVLGFTPVTFGEILIAQYARSVGVPCLMMHSSRIRNYFAFHDNLVGTSSHFVRLMRAGNFPDDVRRAALAVLQESRTAGVVYEGVNLKIRSGRPFRPLASARNLPGAVYWEMRRLGNPVMRADHHDSGDIKPWFYNSLHQPLRATWVRSFLKKSGRQVEMARIGQVGPFAFFPLHSEPEVALQVLGRPYHKNQIELLRNLAASLPTGWKLLVKEHPRSFGLRTREFYRQLMDIPNLRFIDVGVHSLQVVRHAELVAVISSSIGLEAAMVGKPLLIMGHPKYAALPATIARSCYNLFELPQTISALLKEYKYDEEGLLNFLSALIKGSVDVDMYSVLLAKPDRYSSGREGMSLEAKREQDYVKLVEYTQRRIAEEQRLS